MYADARTVLLLAVHSFLSISQGYGSQRRTCPHSPPPVLYERIASRNRAATPPNVGGRASSDRSPGADVAVRRSITIAK